MRERLQAAGLRRDQVEETFIRSGGKGGQNVNKVATCVILRHLPTGLIVRCSAERSQGRNREIAWERLLAKLESLRRSERTARRSASEKERRRKRKRPRALKEKILRSKKKRSETKKNRARVRHD